MTHGDFDKENVAESREGGAFLPQKCQLDLAQGWGMSGLIRDETLTREINFLGSNGEWPHTQQTAKNTFMRVVEL